jgi:hypothetical protein
MQASAAQRLISRFIGPHREEKFPAYSGPVV